MAPASSKQKACAVSLEQSADRNINLKITRRIFPPRIINSAGGKYAVRKLGENYVMAGLISVVGSVSYYDDGEAENKFLRVCLAREKG